VVQLQKSFQPSLAKQFQIVFHDSVEKRKRRNHVLPDEVSKVITTALEHGVDCREVTLHFSQLFFDASKSQA
jgi:hypothetical protein